MVAISLIGLVFYLSILALLAMLSCFILIPAFICIMPFSRPTYRRIVLHVGTTAVKFWAALLEYLGGTRIIIHGDLPRGSGDNSLIISNHRTRIDWMYLWCYLLRADFDKDFDGLSSLKYVLKADLKKIPFAGPIMQALLFMFLTRKDATKDLKCLKDTTSYITSYKDPFKILIFPEGTDLSKSSLERSAKYASKNNLPTYRHVLHPRTTGFYEMFTNLQTSGQLNSVYDVTMLYEDYIPNERPSEKSLLAGRFPKAVHIYSQRYSMEYFNQRNIKNQKDVSEWLSNRFNEKELKLSSPSEFKAQSLASSKHSTSTNKAMPISFKLSLGLLYAFALFITYLISLYLFPKVILVWGGITTCMGIGLTIFGDGLGELEMKRWKKQKI